MGDGSVGKLFRGKKKAAEAAFLVRAPSRACLGIFAPKRAGRQAFAAGAFGAAFAPVVFDA
jgi:hypothetical protein